MWSGFAVAAGLGLWNGIAFLYPSLPLLPLGITDLKPLITAKPWSAIDWFPVTLYPLAIGLGFLMVLRGYDSAAGWFAVSTSIVLAVIASFRSPFSLGETSLSTQPGRRPRKKPVTTPTNPPTGA